MIDAENQLRFVCLPSQGWSFARIPDELHLSKPTLIKNKFIELRAQHPTPLGDWSSLLSNHVLSCFPFRFQFLTFSFPQNCTISAPFCTTFIT